MKPTPKGTKKIPNLYLVGLMGTGKSTVGKLLSTHLGMKFKDSDSVIEEQMGISVSEIFQEYGEDYFRQLEKKFINEEEPNQNCVIACGGGLCVPEGAMEQLKSNGLVICLWANAEILVARTQNDQARPLLLNSEPLDILKALLRDRAARYREANLMIETDTLLPDQVVELIKKQLETIIV
jgi:shikimate kinase